jgi:hypothetical protein
MYGIKVSKPGYDVRTTGDQNLSYSSQYSNLKIYQMIEKTLTVSSSLTPTSTTVNNPLSYSPIYFPFVESTAVAPGKWRPACSNGTPEFTPDLDLVYVGVDYDQANNRFNLTVTQNHTGSRTYTFRIVIFVDKFDGVSSDLGSTETFGIRVSKEGTDVKTGFDTDMSISSGYPNLTINKFDTVSVTGSEGEKHFGEYSHNLGYVPIVMSWVTEDNANYYQQPFSGSFGGYAVHTEVYADSSKIYFEGYFTSHRYIIFDQVLK